MRHNFKQLSAQETLHIDFSGLLKTGWYDPCTQKMVLKRLFLNDTGEVSSCSLFRSPWGQNSSSQDDRFTWKIALQRVFITDIWKPLHFIHLSQEIKLLSGDTGEALSVHFQVYQQTEYIESIWNSRKMMSYTGLLKTGWYDPCTQKMVLKRLFLNDTGEVSSCSLFRSPWGQNSSSQDDRFTWKIALQRVFITDIWKPLHFIHLSQEIKLLSGDTGGALSVHFQVYQQTEYMEAIWNSRKMVLSWVLITMNRRSIYMFFQVSWETELQVDDTEEASTHSLLRTPEKQSLSRWSCIWPL